MTQSYEIYLILNPELSSNLIDSNVDLVSSLITTEIDATNIEINSEGLRKLSYPIAKHTTGYYVLLTFQAEQGKLKNIQNIERKINLNEQIVRYLIVNQTDFLKQKNKEKLNTSSEVANHREFNKGRAEKQCLSRYLGLREIDYKDIDYLGQFVSPYSKIFHRQKTGTSAKFQRKITLAVKRARHMALLSFTPQH